METVELLHKSRKLLEKDDKWTKGEYEMQGRYCAVGAIMQIGGFWGTPSELSIYPQDSLDKLCDVILEQFPDRLNPDIFPILDSPSNRETAITQFNDHKDTTLDEVLAVFDKAQVKAEEAI